MVLRLILNFGIFLNGNLVSCFFQSASGLFSNLGTNPLCCAVPYHTLYWSRGILNLLFPSSKTNSSFLNVRYLSRLAQSTYNNVI